MKRIQQPGSSQKFTGSRILRNPKALLTLRPWISKFRDDDTWLMGVLIAFLFTLLLPLSNAFAQGSTAPYENYLNNMQTLAGDFTQINNRGQGAHGKIQIARPGRLRLTYNPPAHLIVIADGQWLVTIDTKDSEKNYTSLENTPAGIILNPQVSFNNGDITVTNILPKEDGSTEITMIRSQDPNAGHITLIFQDNPIALLGWRVVDTQGQTQVRLSNIQTNIQLPEGLFRVESPNVMQQVF
jgi:outer membrane lipoprotein-sorting protein